MTKKDNKKKKDFFRLLLVYLIPLFILLILLFFNKNLLSDVLKLRNMPLVSIGEVSLLFIFSQILYSLRLKVIMRVFSASLSFFESFVLVNVQSFGNYLPLNAGSAANLIYMNVRSKVSTADFVSYLTADTVIKMFIYGIIGLIASIKYLGIINPINLFLIGFILLGPVILLIPIDNRSEKNGRIVAWLYKVKMGWNLIGKSIIVILSVSIIHIIILLIISLRLYGIFLYLGYEITLGKVVVITVFSNIIRVFSLLPGNLGVRESVISTISILMGYPINAGLSAALIDRVICLIWIFIGGTLFSGYFTKQLINKGNVMNSQNNHV